MSQEPSSSAVSRPVLSPEWTAFTITAVLLSLQLVFFRPYYLVNDDVFKVLMIKGIGICSSPTPYFVYSNILLGFIFMKLNAWFPAVPFYGTFLFAVEAFSLWAFLWVLCLKKDGWFSKVLFLLSVAGVQFVFFIYFQFTITAFWAAGMGLLLFCASLEPFAASRRSGLLAVSGTLLALAWLIRDQAVWGILLAAAPLLVLSMFRLGWRAFWQKQKGHLVCTALFFLLTGLAHWGWFEAHPEWKKFHTFSEEAGRLQQFDSPEYSEKTKPYFDAVGWSENDLWLFNNWYWMDAQKFSLEKVEQLRHMPAHEKAPVVGCYSSWPQLFLSYWNIRVLVYFLLFLLFCRWEDQKILLGQLVWIYLFFFFLLFSIKATDRVVIPLMIFLMNWALYRAEVWSGGKSLWNLVRGLALAAGLAFAFPCLTSYHNINLLKREKEIAIRQSIQDLHPMADQRYMLWSFPFEELSIFDNYERLKPFRMIFATTYAERSPAMDETLKTLGISDPNVFLGAVDNPKVLFMCDPEQGYHYAKYLEENFHKLIRADLVYKSAIFTVYSIHTRRPS